MGVLQGLKVAGKMALKLMTMGLVYTSTNELTNRNRELSKDFNGQIARGYDYYAKPQLEKGLRLIKGDKE